MRTNLIGRQGASRNSSGLRHDQAFSPDKHSSGIDSVLRSRLKRLQHSVSDNDTSRVGSTADLIDESPVNRNDVPNSSNV